MTPILSRRSLLVLSSAALAVTALPAAALTTSQAQALVESLIAEINRIIGSGASESAMIRDFGALFDRYADVPTIARYTLGVDARAASAAQLSAYTAAFRNYIAAKYGRRFREFIGGRVEMVTARQVPNGIEVETRAVLQGKAPFRVDWHVSDASGRAAFFNIIIDGVNMLLSERTEIQAMLDQRGGSIDRLTRDMAGS